MKKIFALLLIIFTAIYLPGCNKTKKLPGDLSFPWEESDIFSGEPNYDFNRSDFVLLQLDDTMDFDGMLLLKESNFEKDITSGISSKTKALYNTVKNNVRAEVKKYSDPKIGETNPLELPEKEREADYKKYMDGILKLFRRKDSIKIKFAAEKFTTSNAVKLNKKEGKINIRLINYRIERNLFGKWCTSNLFIQWWADGDEEINCKLLVPSYAYYPDISRVTVENGKIKLFNIYAALGKFPALAIKSFELSNGKWKEIVFEDADYPLEAELPPTDWYPANFDYAARISGNAISVYPWAVLLRNDFDDWDCRIFINKKENIFIYVHPECPERRCVLKIENDKITIDCPNIKTA